MTHAEKILQAALDLPDDFDDHALVVRAWERDPAAFSLRGTGGRHPNAVAVLCKLPGLVARGFLQRVAASTLRVTPAGRRALDAPPAPKEPAPPPPPRPVVTRADGALLDRLLRSPVGGAVTRPRAVALAEANAFWRAGGGREAVGALLDRACDSRARLASHHALDDRGRLLQLRALHRVLVARFGQAVAA